MNSPRCRWRKEEPQSWYSQDCKTLIYKKRTAPTHGKRGGRFIRMLVARHMPTQREESFTSVAEAKRWACDNWRSY